ncbi:MAG: hypothetical protein U9N34_10285 [Candidatus Cloacimonadota bacterium]|nr:hypothetical protein [Candidatus Cloacimonadota bacterium]
MKHTARELYGIDPTVFIDMNYVDVLVLKHNNAKQLVANAMEEYFMVRNDSVWQAQFDACKHNYKLLEEINQQHLVNTI